MVALKIQTLYAWLLFWVLTHFLYLSHAEDDEPKCLVPSNVYARKYYLGNGNVWFVCIHNSDEAILKCSDDGKWNASFPKCKELSCPIPKDFFGNVVELGENRMWFACRVVFRAAILTCLDDGKWSEPLPNCKDFRCPVPLKFPGRIIFRADGRFVFYCRRSSVASNTICMANGSWSKSIPECPDRSNLPVEVPKFLKTYACKVTFFPHGKYNTSTPNVVSSTHLEFKCDLGYQLEGEPVSVCQKNGKWNPPLPICKSRTTSRSSLTPSLNCFITYVVCLFVKFFFAFTFEV